jgi:hypothetical protein
VRTSDIPDHISGQIENFNIPAGDRGDDIAVALRRFYQRVMICPCMNQSCTQCEFDLDTIVAAWDTSVASTAT